MLEHRQRTATGTAGVAEDHDGDDRRAPGWTLAALGAAAVAFGFQQTGVIPAIPSIQRDLHASQAWSAWLQTGYLVASCVLTPLAGKLGDREGKRRLLVASLLAFLVGSLGASVAPTLGWLIVSRIVQGGGGAVFPLVLAIVREELSGGSIAVAIGGLTGVFGLGTALGFVGGGAIVQALGWRWLFVAGAVATAAATLGVRLVVPRSRARNPAGLDLVGGALLTGGLALLLVSITEGAPLGWGSPWVIGGFALAAALLGAWVAYDLHVEEPLLDLHVLARRSVLLTNLASAGLGFALFSTLFLIPYLVQGSGRAGYGFGADTFVSGLYLLPVALGQFVAGPLAPRLARRFSAQAVFALGLALPAGGAAGLALAHQSSVLVGLWTLLVGAGAGLAIGIASDLVAEAVEAREAGIATSLNSVLRRVGGGIGGQVAAVLLAELTFAGAPANRAFVVAFWAISGVAALGALAALGIGRGAG